MTSRPGKRDFRDVELAFALMGRPTVVWVTPDGFCKHPCLPLARCASVPGNLRQAGIEAGVGTNLAPDLVIIRDREANVATRVFAADWIGHQRAVLHTGRSSECSGLSTSVDKVHLPWRSFYKAVHDERQRLELSRLTAVGTSVHTVSEALFAAETGLVSYLLVGTMFPTPSHPEKQTEDKVEGIALMRAVSEALSGSLLQWYGIGGITAENMPLVLGAGAHGVATIRNIEAVLQYVATKYGVCER
jgi:hypothetical protein